MPARSPVQVRVVIAAALVVATVVVYAQVRDHEFVNYDDYVYLANIDSGLTLEGVRKALTSHIVSNWIPVTWIMLLAEYDWFGKSPAGYHLVSVAIHALSAVLLFAFLACYTRSTWRSAFVAAVFALHPLHVESVAWFSERKDVLSGLFFMLVLHAYARGVQNASRRWRVVAVVCLALGLMAKPMLVTAPFVLVLLDYWPLGRIRPAGARELVSELARSLADKWVLVLLALAASAAALLTQSLAGSVPGTEILTAGRRIANALEAYRLYVGDSLWPAGLAAFYPHPIEAPALWRSLAAALGLLAVTLSAFALRNPAPYFFVGWLWFVGMLVPVIGLVQVGSQARADRYTYLPQIGLAVAVAWGAHAALANRRWGRVALAGAGAAAVAGLGLASHAQVSHWRDTIALHSRAVAVTEDNFRAQNGLAAALRRAGRLQEAAVHYAEASRLAPGNARTHIGRAEVLAELDRLDEAIDAYRAGLAIQPRHIRARINLGHTLMRAERYPEAREQFEVALKIDGGSGLVASGAKRFAVSLHRGMAQVLAREGDWEGAVDQYEKLLALRPGDAAAHAELGEALVRIGRPTEAREHLLEARRLSREFRRPPP